MFKNKSLKNLSKNNRSNSSLKKKNIQRGAGITIDWETFYTDPQNEHIKRSQRRIYQSQTESRMSRPSIVIKEGAIIDLNGQLSYDYNGDGKFDYKCYNPSSHHIIMFYNNQYDQTKPKDNIVLMDHFQYLYEEDYIYDPYLAYRGTFLDLEETNPTVEYTIFLIRSNLENNQQEYDDTYHEILDPNCEIKLSYSNNEKTYILKGQLVLKKNKKQGTYGDEYSCFLIVSDTNFNDEISKKDKTETLALAYNESTRPQYFYTFKTNLNIIYKISIHKKIIITTAAGTNSNYEKFVIRPEDEQEKTRYILKQFLDYKPNKCFGYRPNVNSIKIGDERDEIKIDLPILIFKD